jgi:hypothetical protein
MRIGRLLSVIATKGICSIKVDSEELDLWRQILSWFAERCRDWQHQSSCEFAKEMACATKDANDVSCSCGKGQMQVDFIKDIPGWSNIVGFATRAAISPIFSVPVVDPPFDGWAKSGPSSSSSCATCGKGESSGGGKLLRCSACRVAKYCSSSCQRVGWRSHKQHCGKQGKSRN